MVAESFGKTSADSSFHKGFVEKDWDVIKESLPERHKIDEITWNDLEVDQVYGRINNCKSFFGERGGGATRRGLLYSALHEIGGSGEEYDTLGRKIDFFQAGEADRERVFEYKIHHGPATSRNAVKLLEYMDFPKEIVEDAVRMSHPADRDSYIL